MGQQTETTGRLLARPGRADALWSAVQTCPISIQLARLPLSLSLMTTKWTKDEIIAGSRIGAEEI